MDSPGGPPAPPGSSGFGDDRDPFDLRQYIMDWPQNASSHGGQSGYGSSGRSAPGSRPSSGAWSAGKPQYAPQYGNPPQRRSPPPAYGGTSQKSVGQVSDRLASLPQDLEAEKSVLAAIVLDGTAFDKVIEVGLRNQDFLKESHRLIFEAAFFLYERRSPIDGVTLSSALRDLGTFEKAGAPDSVTGLFDQGFAVPNIAEYARIVREKAIQRRMIQACHEIIGTALGGIENTEAFLDDAEKKVFEVAEVQIEKTMVEMREIVFQAMASIEELALKKHDVTGLPTGFKKFDELTTGLHPGQVMVVAARPGMGKTSWFISAIQHAALKDDAVVAVFSLEMSREEIMFRFLSGLARIDSRKLRLGRANEREWIKLTEAADQLSKARVHIDDSGGLTVMDIRSRGRRILAKENKLDLIVVDYLQLMRGSKASRGGDSREREISEISRGLKELAKELKVPIIAVSQLNRQVESRQDKRPTLADLRESGAIEQDADLVCFIHRDDYYDRENSENKGIAEFIVAKNRHGQQDTIRLAWLAQYTLFDNLSSDEGGMPITL